MPDEMSTRCLRNMEFTFYEPMVKKAARRVHMGAHYLSIEDYEQELWLWLAEYGCAYINKVRKQREEAGNELPDGDVEAIIMKQAKRIAGRELVDYRHFQGDYMYQPAEVKRLILEYLMETCEDVEGRLDVAEAWDAMNKSHPHYCEAVILYHVDGSDRSDATRMRSVRAVNELARLMNDAASRGRVDVEELAA